MRNFGISSLSFENSNMNLLSSPIAVTCMGLKFSLQIPRLKRPVAEGSLQKAARSKATWILDFSFLIFDF